MTDHWGLFFSPWVLPSHNPLLLLLFFLSPSGSLACTHTQTDSRHGATLFWLQSAIADWKRKKRRGDEGTSSRLGPVLDYSRSERTTESMKVKTRHWEFDQDTCFFASSSLRHPRASSRATTKTHRCPHAMYLRIDVEKEKSGITRWSCGLQVLNQEQPNCVFAVVHKMPDGCRCGRTLRCESIIHIDWVGSCCIFHSFILRPHPAGRVVSALTTSLICPHIINICGNLLRWKMALKNATTDFLIPSRSFGIRLSALNFPSVRPVVCTFPPSSSRSISIRLLPYSSQPQKTERASIPQRH